MSGDKKVAIVTGANKGIGLAITKGLARKFSGDVYLTARNEERGLAAIKKLKDEEGVTAHFHQLDIEDDESVKRIRDFMKEKYGGIDVLVNNAATAFLSDPEIAPCIGYDKPPSEPFSVQAEVTIRINYFGLRRVCGILFPILKPGARVVNITSDSGWLSLIIKKPDLKAKLGSDDLTVEELDEIMKDFVKAAEEGNHKEKGYGQSSYCISKVGISALSRIQHQIFEKEGLDKVVNHAHPGFVNTDLTNHKGPSNTDDGARSGIYGALLPPNTPVRGKFLWEDCREMDWVNGDFDYDYKPEREEKS